MIVTKCCEIKEGPEPVESARNLYSLDLNDIGEITQCVWKTIVESCDCTQGAKAFRKAFQCAHIYGPVCLQ